MKTLIHSFVLLLQGYRQEDLELLTQHANVLDELHEQHRMRGRDSQAAECKAMADQYRAIVSRLA